MSNQTSPGFMDVKSKGQPIPLIDSQAVRKKYMLAQCLGWQIWAENDPIFGLRMVCGSYCIRCHMKTSYKFRNQLKISPVTSLKWWCEYPPTSCEVKVIWADGCEKSHLRILWLNKFLGRACCIQWNPSGPPPKATPPRNKGLIRPY